MIDISVLKSYVYDVIGAIYEVRNELGAGLNEACYQEGLMLQLQEQGIPFQRELSFHPVYHGKQMESTYRVDYLCKDNIIVECKAVDTLMPIHRSQLFNYMRLLKKSCGVLVNFTPRKALVERYFYDDETMSVYTVDGIVIK